MGTSASGNSGRSTSGPATPVGTGTGAAVPAGNGGSTIPAGNTGGVPSDGPKATVIPVANKRTENPLNEQENPEADEYIARGKKEKAERIAKAKADATEGAEAETPRAERAEEASRSRQRNRRVEPGDDPRTEPR